MNAPAYRMSQRAEPTGDTPSVLLVAAQQPIGAGGVIAIVTTSSRGSAAAQPDRSADNECALQRYDDCWA
jgi:hypothetical protein